MPIPNHTVKFQGYNSSDLNNLAFTPGDVVYDQTNATLRIMDGTTLGGTSIATQPWVLSSLNNFSNGLHITSTTTSSSSTTGALTVAGGVGISGNLVVSGTIIGNITGAVEVGGIPIQLITSYSAISGDTDCGVFGSGTVDAFGVNTSSYTLTTDCMITGPIQITDLNVAGTDIANPI